MPHDLMLGEHGWYAIALASEIRPDRPLKRWLFGQPIVLFGRADAPSVLLDRCPHRSAPLSAGKIVDGMIECPFHGWRFDGSGVCRKMPCFPGEPPLRKARSLQAIVRYGLVFVRMGKGAAEPPPPVLHGQRAYVHLWSGLSVKGELAHVAENFLDATHTITVHAGLLRGTNPAAPAQIVVRGRRGEVEITYRGEDRPSGLLARLFEGERSSTVGRFRGPNVTDVEFHGPRGLRFGVTSYLTPTEPGMVGGFAVVAVPGNALLGRLKFAALKPFATLVNRQDMRMLNLVDDNHARFGRPPRASAPTDYVVDEIEAILAGNEPASARQARTLNALL
jgi:phenylpropionate dioxygenase-like ring-hydroxylating dioxygenase large terminal subunit